MSQIKIFCSRDNKNTGKTDCVHNPKLDKGGYLAPVANCTITPANQADIVNFINSQVHHADPNMRWHLVGPFEGMEDKGEKTTTQTLPNGRIIVVDRSHPAEEYQVLDGGKCYHQALQSFNNMHEFYVWFPFDTDNNLMGTVAENGVDMTGYTLTALFTHDWDKATRSTSVMYKIFIAYADAAERNENYYVINVPKTTPLHKIKGVQDVTIKPITPGGASAGVFTISLFSGCGNKSLVDLGSALATASNFYVLRASTRNVISITGVAINTLKTGVEITTNTSDPDYLAGEDAYIGIADVTTLSGNGLKWFEGNEITVELT